MWIRLFAALTFCPVLVQVSGLSAAKTIHLPPRSPENLLLGCFEQKNGDASLYQPSQSALSPLKCAQACANETFPLAAVTNGTDCHCANDGVAPLVDNGTCVGSPSHAKVFYIYNTSCFVAETVELYQVLRFPFSVSPFTLVTQSNVTERNASTPIVYWIQFGDGRTTSFLGEAVHRYATTGEFNVTLVASLGNSTTFISSRIIRVLSQPRVAGMKCPTKKPRTTAECAWHGPTGSDVTLRVTMDSTGQNVSLTVPETPRVVLGQQGLPVVNKSDAGDVGPGIYVLQTLAFSTFTYVEAWELYAEYPGRIQLQVYRAQRNKTRCKYTWHSQDTCGDWVPASGSCDRVCVCVGYYQHALPISSCAYVVANYSKVYEVEVNLTVGYNLIVIPQGERFVADIGDIVGFQRNTSGAVLQRTTVRQTPGVYYSRAQPLSKLSVHLQSLVALNFSFRVMIHGSIKEYPKLAVSCLQKAGIYALTTVFSNPLLEQNKSLAPVFQSIITVQNPIRGIKVNYTPFIAVNRSKKITGSVLQGTNVTCVWRKPSSSLTERYSLYLEKDRTTEGATCEKEFSFPYAGYVTITLRAFNLVSKKRTSFHLSVREIIQGLKVEMCHSSFAYDNAVTCYNSSITSGTHVGCTWYFSPTDYIKRQIGLSIVHRLTPVGVTNFTLYCYNKLPEIRNATFRVQVVANPLSIIAPLTVAVDAPVTITCRINWPYGSPANFFDRQGLTERKGTDIRPFPVLTVRSNAITNTSKGSVTLHERFLTKGQHKIDCTADRYPDLNTFHMINAVHPIKYVTITTTCPSRIEVGASCRFQVNGFRGDSSSFRWTVSEGHSQISVYSGSDIDHRFANIGLSNVSVNISNDASWSLKFIEVIVYSNSSMRLPPSASSPSIHFIHSSTTVFPSSSLAASNSNFIQPTTLKIQTTYSSQASYTSHITYTSQTSFTRPTTFSKHPGPTSSSGPHIVPSLNNAELHYEPSALVGHAILFTVIRVEKPHLFRFVWNWNDQSPLKETRLSSTNHTFTEPGQYVVSVNISSESSHVVLSGLVTVQYPIRGLQIRDIALGSSNLLTVEFDILQGNNITYLVDFGDLSDITPGFLVKLPTSVVVTHQYKEPGTYNLSISASSVVGPGSTVQRLVIVMETPCTINELRMLGAGANSNECPEIQQEYEYSLYSSVIINCHGMEELKNEWKVERILTNFESETIPFQEEMISSEVLFLAAQSLKGGLYQVTLSVTAIPYGISKAKTGFLRVRMPNLLATINCGSERVMPWNREVVLDGSSSRDPNDIGISPSASLSFKWFCNQFYNISCFGGKVNNTQPVLKFPEKFLERNLAYQFVLLVSKDSRRAEASQTITVVAENFPPLCVRCQENCAQKLTTSKKLVLTGEGCSNNTGTLETCRWELYGPPSPHGISRRSVGSQLISVSYSNQFKLDPNKLIPNQTYKISFNNVDSNFSTQYSVITDMFPSGGSCVVSPSEGVVMDTQFRINCTGWSDEDSPLWYEFFLRDPTFGPMLLCYGWMPYSRELFLPPGQEKNNFGLELFVKIIDVLGSYSQFPLEVKVTNFHPNAGSVSSILKRIVSGPDSMLESLLAAGEFQKATQLVTTVITVLNQHPSQVTSPDSPDAVNRAEVRGTVIQGLSGMCCGSPQGIRQALVGLLQAIRVTAELSPDSLVNGASVLSNMAKTLVTKFKSVPAEKTIKGILVGLKYVLEASVAMGNEIKEEQSSSEIKDWIDDSNEARNKDHQVKCERATNKSLEGVDHAAQKLLDFQRKGDSPSHVTTNLMTLRVTRQSAKDIDDAALDGGEVTFHIPSEVKNDKLGQFDAVNTKVITMSMNPFISNNAIPINTPVSTLEVLETSGNEIEIQDLVEPISVFLSVKESQSDDLNNMSGVTSSTDDMTVFNIENGEQNGLYFTINCSGSLTPGETLTVFGRRNSRPSNKKFDLSWSLSSCNTTLMKLLSRRYLNNSESFYVGVKLFGESNVTNTSTAPREVAFSVSVKAVGCYYWNENMQAWRTDGCEVGPLTTMNRIHCQCNHLTWFGSRVFVPPNKLHFDIIAAKIKDPANYAPVLAVLCTTCGVYLLIVVWARREDQRDTQKIGMFASPSNRPGDAHAYEVIISTGMRRHAGTSANVAMTMTGEHGESHPFLLKNSQCMTLGRSSVNSFLVTTSQSLGDLSYIRVWHDNFGEDPAWYIKQVSIREIPNNGVWHFLCERWLAVDEGDGSIDRIFPVASNKEMEEFRHLFLTKAYKDLSDSHLWFSVVWRPPQSPFTRVQRVSCCFSLLLCTMMANAMWYEADKGSYTAVEIGAFEFSWEQVTIGICSSLIVFPINLILVQIFRHCRARPSQEPSCKQRERTSSTETEVTTVRFQSNQGSTLSINRPADLYQRVNKTSPTESPTMSTSRFKSATNATSRVKELCRMSAKRSAHLPSFSMSLAAAASSNSTNDTRSLLQGDSRACSPADTEEKTKTSEGEQTSTRKRLPWWFVYIGWALVIITSLTAASVTLLYGTQFGLKKSTQWLLSMFFSVTQDIFVSQPLKVIGLAIFFAYIFKKPNKVNFSTSLRDRSDEQLLGNQLSITEKDLEEYTAVPDVKVPPEAILQHVRSRAAKERAMHNILLDFGTFLVFALIVLLIAYGLRDQDAFYQNDSVAKVLLSKTFSGRMEVFKRDTFSKIIRQRDIWDWTENALLPTLYNLPLYFYTGKAPEFMEGMSGLVVGLTRLRQHRVKKDSCYVAPLAEGFFARCIKEYDSTSEDDQAYTAGWDSIINNTELQKPISSLGPWHYYSAGELSGYPYVGKVTTYSGGGYVMELSHIYYKAVRQIKKARSKLWLDLYTRSVFVEFSLYNPDSNLFCATTFLMETPSTGGVFPRAEVLTYRLYRYIGDFQLFILACEVFYLAFVLYFTVREAKKIYKTRQKYFAEVWNLIDLVTVVLCWIAMAYYFICLGLRKWTLNLYHKNPTKFISFQYLSAWQLMFEGVIGVTVFVTFLKFIKIFRFNRRIFLLSCTLRHAGGELRQYLIVFTINFMAFAQIYHLLLGSEYGSFSTLFGSMQKLLSVLLGKFNIEEMLSAYKVLGTVIFLLYMTITNFLLLNVLIVIIIDSFKVVKQQNDEMQNEFELLEYIMARFRDVLGLRKLNKAADSPFAYSNRGGEPKCVRNVCAQKREMTKELDQALDKLDSYLDTMQDLDDEDDMLCYHVSSRIHRRGPAIKIELVERFT